MSHKTDLDAIDRLREQFERNVRPYDYITALHNAYPALAAELREARKRVRELEAEIEVRDNCANLVFDTLKAALPNRGFHSEMEAAEAALREIAELRAERDAAVLIIHLDGHSTDEAKAMLDARDRRMKRLGAVEALQAIAAPYGGDATGCNPQILLDALIKRAAELEAAGGGRGEWLTR